MTRWMLDLRYPSAKSAYPYILGIERTCHKLQRVGNVHSESLHQRLHIFPFTTSGQHLQCGDRLAEKECQASHIRVSVPLV